MAMITCAVCGGKLKANEEGSFVCKDCGLEYSAESLRSKLYESGEKPGREEPVTAESGAEKSGSAGKKKAVRILLPVLIALAAAAVLIVTVAVTGIQNRAFVDGVKASAVGNAITFGKYEQDNNRTNGSEDIEWIVLAKEDNKALVISRYALDAKPYNTENTDTTWETCSLRSWLNGELLETAFSKAEQSRE